MRLLAPLLLLAGCQPSLPPSTPEQALRACERAGLPALRATDPAISGLSLGPVAAANVEQHPEGEPRMVLRGMGRAVGGSTAGDVRWLCLMASGGGVLFVDVAPANASAPVDGCGTDAVCLRRLLDDTELGLADAEAGAVRAASRAGAVDDPVAASIGAWRVYRDAECSRRRDLSPNAGVDACRVAMTRARIRELTRP